jgi:leucyl aminopeptidase
VLVVPVVEGATSAPAGLDAALAGRLAALLAAGVASGRFGDATLVHLENGGVKRVALVGVGRSDRVDADAVRTATSAAVREARRVGGTIAYLVDSSLPVSADEQARAAVDGIVLGEYDPSRWKTDSSDDAKPFDTFVLAGVDGATAESGAREARVAAWTNRARDLSNAPPNELTPERLAERAEEYAKLAGNIKVETLDRKQIEKLGMGAFAGVAQGSDNEPRLIVMHYAPNASSDVKLGLVGKAVTFDTGGISLKPALNMENMKGDMSGGAAVIAGICAIADLGLPVSTVVVVAATENMPGGHAFRPGDILKAANGKTIEITNTDAEGRLVLADALWYAREQGATHVADFATLTGAMVAALGDFYAGLFANDEAWADRILAAARTSGDHLWRMPLHPRYRRYVDSTYADMKNSSDLREAGPALAAEFLQEFAGEGPWAHLDIAGPAFLDRSRGDYLWQPGGTGYGVRLIAELARGLAA